MTRYSQMLAKRNAGEAELLMQQPENTINMGGAPISPSALEMALKIAETHGEVHIVGVSTFHRNSLMEMAAFLMGMYEKVRHAKD